MKKTFFLILIFIGGRQLMAQVPEDAIRMSWNAPSGTARNQAIGGAAGSLGGDISSVFVNPAGLGFYKTNEVVLSPGISLLNGKSNFRDMSGTADAVSRFNLGTSGVVWGNANPRSRWGNQTYSLAINKTANFNGSTFYRGQNDFSSFSESFAEELSYSGVSIDAPLYSAPLSLGAKLATYAYLIDTATIDGLLEVVGLPQRNAILNGINAELYQEKNIQTRGGITEIAFGYAANMDDKVFVGFSLGIPIVSFDRTSIFTERDISGDDDNNFNSATYREEYSSNGLGINGRLGIIVKPAGGSFRAGLAIHSPTLYGLKETTTGRMEADLEHYFSDGLPRVATADSIYTQFGADIPQYKYDMVSPWKFVLSGSYLINGVEDVTQQRGFVTADIEYVTHASTRYSSAEQNDDDSYYKGVNEGIKLSYKGAFNFRVGGELKFNTLMTRLGFSYYGSPYEDSQLKAHKMNISGGVGYRNRGMFLDLTYVYGLNRDVDFPYRLSDKANTFADIRNNNGNLILTLGMKF